jgi:protein-tyrosine phosphatase
MKTTLYWIDGPWRGGLAIMPRPRGGDWLESEVQSWKAASVEVVISALTNEETAELDLQQEAELCQAIGLEFRGFPIADREVPESFGGTAELVRQVGSKLADGMRVAIHCRQGIGRSALLAACFLVSAGVDSDTAFDRLGLARGYGVPDTAEQREWVAKLGRVFRGTRPE